MAYTHDFEFKLEGKTIEGEVEFNTDGKMGYKILHPIEWKDMVGPKVFRSLLETLKVVFDHFGGITKIELVKKDV